MEIFGKGRYTVLFVFFFPFFSNYARVYIHTNTEKSDRAAGGAGNIDFHLDTAEVCVKYVCRVIYLKARDMSVL